MDSNRTYWRYNGTHQTVVRWLSEMRQRVGKPVPGSILNLFYVASQAYNDLYAHQLKQAATVLPPLVDALGDLKERGYHLAMPYHVDVAIEELVDHYQHVVDARATAEYTLDREVSEQELVELFHPDSSDLHESFEHLIDYICELCHHDQDVFNPLPKVPTVAKVA